MTAVPAAAAASGTAATTTAGRCPTASTGCASRCATRAARRRSRRRRSSTRRRRARRSASASSARDPRKRMGNIISQGDRERARSTSAASRASRRRFRVLRTDEGKPREVTKLELHGRAHRAGVGRRCVDGKPLDPGTYIVQAEVRDTAGNVGVTPAEFEVGAIPGRPGLTVRGLAAQPPLRPVTAGQRVEFRVDARGAAVPLARAPGGRLGGAQARHGDRPACSPSARPRARRASTCSSCAPAAGTRRCRSWSRPRSARACSWSCPAITWLGTDKVDDPPFDGLPNTLDRRRHGALAARVRRHGRAAGRVRRRVAPLLVFLDRQRIRYDLTSDLDLDLTRNPRAIGPRRACCSPARERWITRTLAQRLRRYVTDGGRVAMFGGDTMRRGVRLRVYASPRTPGRCRGPTQPTSTDPFGARIGKARTLPAPADAVAVRGRVGVRADGGRARPAGLHACSRSRRRSAAARLTWPPSGSR